MSIKQFIAGFALEKASQIKESKKDILDTINTRLSTHLTGLQDRNKQFINMSSEAYGRLEQLKSYAKIYNLNEAELAVAAMDQDLTNRIMKNATRPYVAEKIKELGGLFKSSGKTPGMTPEQYIDIFTKKKLKTIYPNQNLIFSDVETMAGLGTRGFTQRKIERAKAQADYAKSLYAFNQTTPSDVTMKDFTLRPEVFTDPGKAVSEKQSSIKLQRSNLVMKLRGEKDPNKIKDIRRDIQNLENEYLSLDINTKEDVYSFNNIQKLFNVSESNVISKYITKVAGKKIQYDRERERYIIPDSSLRNTIANETYNNVSGALFKTFEAQGIKSSSQLSTKVVNDMIVTAASYGKKISVDEIRDDFDEYIKSRTPPVDVPDPSDNNNLTPSNNNNVQSGSNKNINQQNVTKVNLVPLQNVINKYRTKFPELESPEYLKDKQKLLDFFTNKFEKGLLSSKDLLDIQDNLQ